MTTNPRSTKISLLILIGAVLPPSAIILLPLVNTKLNFSKYYRPADTTLLAESASSLFEQLLICVVAFGVKQIYEVMALVIIIKLWRSNEKEAIFLRWGMTAFLLGELSCAFNYLIYKENSLIMEYFHVFGMLVCFGFIFYIMLSVLDSRVLKYSAKNSKCALLFFCKYCYKTHPVPCTARQIYQILTASFLLLCLLPISGGLGSYFIVSNIFDDQVVLGHSLAQQVLETIIFPGTAAVFFIFVLYILIKKKEEGFREAKVMLAAGAGALGFSLMRFVLFWSFKYDPIWADIWEELTEFIFVSCSLYIVFLATRARAPQIKTNLKL